IRLLIVPPPGGHLGALRVVRQVYCYARGVALSLTVRLCPEPRRVVPDGGAVRRLPARAAIAPPELNSHGRRQRQRRRVEVGPPALHPDLPRAHAPRLEERPRQPVGRASLVAVLEPHRAEGLPAR